MGLKSGVYSKCFRSNWEIATIKKPLPARTGVVYRHSIEVNQMNDINLIEQPTKFKAEEFLVGDMVVINELEYNEFF